MGRKFAEFMKEVEAEARREGPEAVAEARALESHFRLAAEFIALRKHRNLTQRQLSSLSGIQQSEISRIEAARANPTLGTLRVVAGALGADIRLVERTRPSRPSATLRTRSPARRR
ncbi:MAG: helix-turn-helix transcriptional regulator [Deltaproteobacteria bacterium]